MPQNAKHSGKKMILFCINDSQQKNHTGFVGLVSRSRGLEAGQPIYYDEFDVNRKTSKVKTLSGLSFDKNHSGYRVVTEDDSTYHVIFLL